jgi:hypothetical protein
VSDSEILTEIKFWQIVIADARKTVLCPPDLESRLKGYVDARLLGGIIRVVASPYCPEDQVLILPGWPPGFDTRETTGA